ncbi:MAG: hypothetical protein LBH41_02410 [Rickettsiales bacterium]|jgi:hypothetical protein|nr:hypothetical protein [Rickettsiales bacterium]
MYNKFIILLLCGCSAQSLSYHDEKPLAIADEDSTDEYIVPPFIPLPDISMVAAVPGASDTYNMDYTGFGLWMSNIGLWDDNEAYDLANVEDGYNFAYKFIEPAGTPVSITPSGTFTGKALAIASDATKSLGFMNENAGTAELDMGSGTMKIAFPDFYTFEATGISGTGGIISGGSWKAKLPCLGQPACNPQGILFDENPTGTLSGRAYGPAAQEISGSIRFESGMSRLKGVWGARKE